MQGGVGATLTPTAKRAVQALAALELEQQQAQRDPAEDPDLQVGAKGARLSLVHPLSRSKLDWH